MRFWCVPLTLALAALLAAPAFGQDDDYDYSGESDKLELYGLAQGAFVHSFQDTSLPGGGSFNDGNGFEAMAGFGAGKYFAFLLSWEFQTESDFDTHYIPFNLRMYSPPLLEDRLKLYGQASIGLFFSRLHNEFNNPQTDNERGSAVRAGGGVEIGITDDISGVLYGNYLWGLGSTDDYEYATLGGGLVYRWDF